MSENVLTIENATMQFGGVVAVDNLNLKVDKDQIVSLIGPNGAGKTTAFNVVTGVYAPTNGAVWFEGRKIIENTPHGKMKKLYKGQNASKYSHMIAPTPDKITQMGIARTFQNIRLWKSQTVFENVLIAKHCRRSANLLSATFRLNADEEKRQREECENLLHMLGLEDVRNELATGLPYGLQRRVEIARALATEPKLLLLDEPAAGMNPQETEEHGSGDGYFRPGLCAGLWPLDRRGYARRGAERPAGDRRLSGGGRRCLRSRIYMFPMAAFRPCAVCR